VQRERSERWNTKHLCASVVGWLPDTFDEDANGVSALQHKLPLMSGLSA